MHVHVVIDSLNLGGAEALLADMARGSRSAGLELSVGYLAEIGGSPILPRLREAGIEPQLIGVSGLVGRTNRVRMHEHLRAVSPDVVHTQLAYADIIGLPAARRLGTPAVSTVHLSQWTTRSARELARMEIAALVRRTCAARTLLVSEHARDAYARRFRGRTGTLETVPNGVVDDRQEGAGRRVRRELGLDAEDVVVLMLAVLREGKGHDLAVDALERLRAAHSRLRLVIAGDGPRRAEVAALAARAPELVTMCGQRDDVMALLDASDVLLHPTSFDAFPTALLEAMAAGVPVVATSVGGVPEIAVDGESAVLMTAPPSISGVQEAVATVLRDPALRRRLAASGRARFVERFDAQRWCRRLRDSYEQASR